MMRIKEFKLKVPTELNDVKLSQYQKFVKTTKDKEDNEFVARQLVGIFCDINNELVGKIKRTDFDNVVNTITKTLEKEPKLETTFVLNGVKYGFIPKLDDITVDEQSDLDNLLKDLKNWDKAAAVMFRPITTQKGGKYRIEEYKGDGKSLDVPLGVMLGAVSFFLNLRNELLNCTLNYIDKEVAKDNKLSQILERNGVGIKIYTLYQELTSLNLRRLVS